jgi:hypothetical protein
VGADQLMGGRAHICRFRFQDGTDGLREINGLQEMSPAAFSLSIETETTLFRFQLELIDRLIVLTMNAFRSSSTAPRLRPNAETFSARLLVDERLDGHARGRIERETVFARSHHIFGFNWDWGRVPIPIESKEFARQISSPTLKPKSTTAVEPRERPLNKPALW